MPVNSDHKIPLKHRIAYKQSLLIIVVAFVLGLIFSFGQIYVDHSKQVQSFADNIQQVISTLKRPASEAAFHLDSELAEQVANGLFEYSAIVDVEINGILGTDQSLVQLIKMQRPAKAPDYPLLASWLFDKQNSYQVPLYIEQDGEKSIVGQMQVGASPNEMTDTFFDRALSGILFGILRIIIFASVILVFFYYAVTRPLETLSKSWAQISPEQPSEVRLNLANKHKQDEFGVLAQNANRFLSALEEHLDRRHKAEQALIQANETLENRVVARTAELQTEIAVRIETERALHTTSEIILLLKKLAVIANEASSFKDAVQSSLSAIGQSIHWPLGHAYLLPTDNPNGTIQKLRYVQEYSDDRELHKHLKDFVPSDGVGMPGYVLAEKKYIWVEDLSQQPYAPDIDLYKSSGLKSSFAFPVLVDQQVVAIIEFFSPEKIAHNASLVDALDDIAIQLTRVIEREKTAQLLTAAKEEAIEATKAKSIFLATMSHEIRTPMNGVQGMLQVLEKTPLNDEQQETVRVIGESAEMLTTIIDDILDFSKIEAEQLEIETLVFSLPSIMESITALMSPRAHEKSLELTLNIDPNLPQALLGDPVRIRQILLNLVSNALKFTTEGQVSIRISSQSLHSNMVHLLFEVQDTGCGLTEEQLANLFLPFVQADTSISRRFGGTGLGLSICQRLVELLGGKIGVESQFSQGSRFWFTLECAVADDTTLLNQTKQDGIQPVPLKLLVVEDNPINQKVADNLLRDEGHQVLCASNGKQALELLHQQDIDCIFMDMHMPEMDGLETTRHIRALSKPLSETPIIMLSADVLSNAKTASLDAGVNHFISKPFKLEQINQILVDLFGARETVANLQDSSEIALAETNTVRTDTQTISTTQTSTTIQTSLEQTSANTVENGLVDCEGLAGIRRSVGDELLAELIDDFQQHCENHLLTISLAIENKDLELISDSAHSIKGAAKELKATRFAKLAEGIEHADNIAEVISLYPQLTHCLEDTLAAFMQLDHS